MNQFPVIPRLEDLPYHTSPPIEFLYQSAVSPSAGSYVWANNPTALVPNRPLMENALYYFRSLTLAADLDEYDFTTNTTALVKFQMYLKSRAKSILFREPIYMAKFLQNFDYRLVWHTQAAGDQIFASFTGTIYQGTNLVGKQTIHLTAIVSAQEIVDEHFVKLFKNAYPGVHNG